MTIYNGLFEPKKSAIKDCGAVQLAIAVEAPNKKIAESIITGKLWESYPANGDNYFKPKLWEHEEGQPLPTVGQFDELFAQQHTFDGEKWVSITANGTAGEESSLPADDDVIDLMAVSQVNALQPFCCLAPLRLTAISILRLWIILIT